MAHHHSSPPSPSSPCCFQGHSTALLLPTAEGGSICLICLSNLISYPQKSPRIHISYALSQLSHALCQPQFLRTFLTFHSHFLISPLVHTLSSLNDSVIAQQIFDLILLISDSAADADCVNVYGEFVARVSEMLSSGSLAWSRQQFHTLHCMGLLLDHQKTNPHVYVKDKDAFVFNLITGLQLSSEEIQGEVLFVLYKVVHLQEVYKDYSFDDILLHNCAKLLHLSLQALMKTQSDDVRLNCVALLTVLARRGWFQSICVNEVRWRNSFEADNFVRTTERMVDEQPLNALFAEAIKGPLLSSDSQVQVAALDLVFLYLTGEADCTGQIQELVQENIADYVFEILRQSGCKDPLLSSCIQVLDLLSTAEQVFRQRLAIGFTTLVPALRYTTEFPFHPAQTQSIKLLFNCVSEFPGLVSKFHVEEISHILTGMVRKQLDGEAGILPATFNLACLTLIALMKCSSSCGALSFLTSLRDASVNAVLNCLRDCEKHPEQFLYSLNLLKEVYAYNHDEDITSPVVKESKVGVIRVCKDHILPWFLNSIDSMEEDIILAVLETFHSLLVQDSSAETKQFADILASSSWFSRLLGCLGLFPSESMKLRVYMMFSLILDALMGDNCGQTIRDVATDLPSDPTDLLFLLGQNSSLNLQMASCQSAVLLILYVSSLYDDSLADNKLVLASLDQYILINASEMLCGTSVSVEILINLYGLYRGLAKMNYQIPYSTEAEKILFHILAEKDWDLLSTRIHFISLKWLFQQEKIWKLLSEKMLELCRRNNLEGNHVVVYGNNDGQYIEVRTITELIVSADNFGPMLFVCLLGELVEQDDREHDIISVLNTIAEIVELIPDASNILFVHGIGCSILNLYNHPLYPSSPNISMAAARLVYIFLQSVQSSTISDEDVWAAIITKLMGNLIDAVKQNSWTEESLMVIGTLSLVLYHSTKQALTEASRLILLSKPLAAIINRTISDSMSRSAALADLDEGTRAVESLVLWLILIFFSMRSLQSVLPGMLDSHTLLEEHNEIQTLSCFNLQCRDFCKLVHFGSPTVKLISSYCLVELFNRISNNTSTKPENSKTATAYLASVKAVLEGLIFYTDDVRTSINCAHCLSKLLGWEDLEKKQTGTERNYWCRMIVEELAMSLAVPNLASRSFMIHHKPAVHVAVALLRLKKVPLWMPSVFDDSCINGIIDNISTSNVTPELVLLLRQLLTSGYLNADHVAKLNRVFQACRNHLYTDETQNGLNEVKARETVTHNNSGKVCEFLINLVTSLSSNNQDFQGLISSNAQVLSEIELFSRSLTHDHKV